MICKCPPYIVSLKEKRKDMDRFHGLVDRYFLVFLSDGTVIQMRGYFPNKKTIMELIGNGCFYIVNIMELNKEDWEEWGR